MIKKHNLAQHIINTEILNSDRYILSIFPALWVPMTEGHHSDGSTFLSSDGVGHVCTVTGALWTPQGRYFTTDDEIWLSDAPGIKFANTGELAVGFWLKMSTPGAQQHIFRKGFAVAYYAYASTDGTISFKIENTGADSITFTGAIDNAWRFVWLQRRAGNLETYVDGASVASPVASTKNPGSDLKLHIGAGADAGDGPAEFLTGTIGEFLIYSRAFSPLEIQRLYLATKWRFK